MKRASTLRAAGRPKPVRTRSTRSRRAARAREAFILAVARLSLLAVVLGAWQLASGDFLDPFFFSSPMAIGEQLWELFASGEVWPHLWVTLQEMAAGFAIGATAGIATGLAFGTMPFLGKVFDPFIIAFYSLPKIALAPLLILWFGIDLAPKIVLSAIIVYFLVFFNTLSGVRAVDIDLVNVLRVMGATKRQVMMKVTVPSALTWIFAGLKVSVPYALVGAVTGELIASSRGLGFLVQRSAAYFDTTGVFAALFILMLISTTLDQVLGVVEGRYMRWRRSNSQSVDRL